jgi:hypothetical protein
MSGGISWENLHEQILELLPGMDPAAALVARQALEQGQHIRYDHWPAGAQVTAVLEQLDAALLHAEVTGPDFHILLAVRDMLHGLLPIAPLASHLVAAWPRVELARSLLALASHPAAA